MYAFVSFDDEANPHQARHMAVLVPAKQETKKSENDTIALSLAFWDERNDSCVDVKTMEISKSSKVSILWDIARDLGYGPTFYIKLHSDESYVHWDDRLSLIEAGIATGAIFDVWFRRDSLPRRTMGKTTTFARFAAVMIEKEK